MLYGNNGEDNLRGQGGNDVVIAWADAFTIDHVWGGNGNDTCYLSFAIDRHEDGCESITYNHWA